MKRNIALLLSLILLVGCGKVTDTSIESGEILIDPVVGTPAYAVASYHNLYDVEVFSAVVSPEIYEYSYETDKPFGSYNKVPGDLVSTGDVLAAGKLEGLDEKLEDLYEMKADAQYAYEKKHSDLTIDLAEAKKIEAEKGTLSNSFDSDYVPMNIQGDARKAAHNSKLIQNQIEDLEATYNCEINHYDNLIAIANSSQENVSIISDRDGVVVGIATFQVGESVPQGSNISAVADTSVKKLDTEFINAGKLKKAEDIYAIIEGKRYEVTPRIIESKEYKQLEKVKGTVYSSFVLPKDCEADFGTYGVVVLTNEIKENVLCVPNDSLTKEGLESYVNIYEEDGTITKAQVKCGSKDGLFTEILSGIEAGTKVLSDATPEKSKKTSSLVKGEVFAEFSETGYLYCPSMNWVKNPAKHGTFYLNELLVEEYEQVEAGQEIAKIEVVTDGVEIKRLERKIQREQERLNDLMQDAATDYSDKINYARNREIRDRKDTITELQKQIDELSEYSGIITLRAPFSGMVVVATESKSGDVLRADENIALLCDYSQCFLIVDDPEARLGFGKEVSVTYTDASASKNTISGKVVNANRATLSSDLVTNEALIALDTDTMQSLIEAGSSHGDSGWYRTRFTIESKVRNMDNVVLVPKSAVIEQGGDFFVRVKTDEDIELVSFVVGGSDLSNYWVVEGLDEGMEICLD